MRNLREVQKQKGVNTVGELKIRQFSISPSDQQLSSFRYTVQRKYVEKI